MAVSMSLRAVGVPRAVAARRAASSRVAVPSGLKAASRWAPRAQAARIVAVAAPPMPVAAPAPSVRRRRESSL